MDNLKNILNKIAEAQRGGDYVTPDGGNPFILGQCCVHGECRVTSEMGCRRLWGEWFGPVGEGETPCEEENVCNVLPDETGRCCVYSVATGKPIFILCGDMTSEECANYSSTGPGVLNTTFTMGTDCAFEYCPGSDEWENEQTRCCTQCRYTDVDDGTTYGECSWTSRRECLDRNGQDNFIPGWKCNSHDVDTCDGCREGTDFKDKFDVNR